jgi:hypothetical protein
VETGRMFREHPKCASKSRQRPTGIGHFIALAAGVRFRIQRQGECRRRRHRNPVKPQVIGSWRRILFLIWSMIASVDTDPLL